MVEDKEFYDKYISFLRSCNLQDEGTIDSLADYLELKLGYEKSKKEAEDRVITVQKVVDVLNEIHKVDPKVLSQLVFNRVKCNDELADHPTVQVAFDDEGDYAVGLLGILNGIFGCKDDGYGYIGIETIPDTGLVVKFLLV